MTYVGQGLLGWDKRLLWVDESEEHQGGLLGGDLRLQPVAHDQKGQQQGYGPIVAAHAVVVAQRDHQRSNPLLRNQELLGSARLIVFNENCRV